MEMIREHRGQAVAALAVFLASHSTRALRLSVGLIFLLFGVLKFFPGVSPAENLVVSTTRLLTFGTVPDGIALIGVAILECSIGGCLLWGRQLLPVGLLLLVPQLIGILSPIVLLPNRLFSGTGGAPTLEGQYVIKDVVLVGAAMVIACQALVVPKISVRRVSARQKLEIVLSGIREECPLAELCDTHGIAESDYETWKSEILAASAEITQAQQTAATPAITRG